MNPIDIARRSGFRTARFGPLAVSVLLVVGAQGVSGQEPEPAPSAAQSASNTRLVVMVTGVESREGRVAMALFDSEESYADMSSPSSATYAPIDDDLRATWTLDDVAPGRYVVSVYHDKNASEDLDTNFIGLPQERYGFSNDARGRFGPPGFDDAAFTVEAGVTTTIQIEVR